MSQVCRSERVPQHATQGANDHAPPPLARPLQCPRHAHSRFSRRWRLEVGSARAVLGRGRHSHPRHRMRCVTRTRGPLLARPSECFTLPRDAGATGIAAILPGDPSCQSHGCGPGCVRRKTHETVANRPVESRSSLGGAGFAGVRSRGLHSGRLDVGRLRSECRTSAVRLDMGRSRRAARGRLVAHLPPSASP